MSKPRKPKEKRWSEGGKCNRCGRKRTKEGHDPCLGTLPGVANACCGHGAEGYINFENGVVIGFTTREVLRPDRDGCWLERSDVRKDR